MDVVALGGRVLLALVFAVAAVGKLTDREGARRALRDFRVPARLVAPSAWLLPVAELTVAVALLVQGSARAGAIGAALLLFAFMAGIAAAISRGEAPDCNCFGQIGSAPAGRGTLVRNAVLASVAVALAVYGAGRNPASWLAGRPTAEVLVLVLGLVSVAAVAALAGVWRERARLRTELGRARDSLAVFPPGLPIGADAPAFALAAIAGGTVSLSDLLARGRPLALVFASPTCAPCRYMMDDIARWQRTLADRITIAVIATGTVAEARQMSATFDMTDVLVQDGDSVFNLYRASGTPSVVMVSPDGRIASRIRTSQGVVEAAIRQALESAPAIADPAPPAAIGRGAAEAVTLEVTRWSGGGAQPA